jgi:pimeloyl-ACP methyl ester carboxylesterase
MPAIQLEHLITYPAQKRHHTPILLIHGAWHDAWCWEQAMADLAARGFEVHAVSLRGHGGSPQPPNFARSTIIQYVSDVRSAIAAVGPRPLVVGHSIGGLLLQLIITGVAGPAPELAGAVLLCSSPVSLQAYFAPRPTQNEPLSMGDMLKFEPRAMRAGLFRADISDAELEHRVSRMVHEPPLVIPSSMLLRPRPDRCRTRVLVIAAGHDAIYTPEVQREIAAAYRGEFVVVPNATHDLMFDPDWPIAAASIAHFAEQS